MVLYKNIDISKIDLTIPEKVDGTYRSYIKYNGKQLKGVQSESNITFNCCEPDKESSCFALPDFNGPFFEFMLKVREHLIEIITNRSEEFFKKKFPREILEERFPDNMYSFLNKNMKVYDHLGEITTYNFSQDEKINGTLMFDIDYLTFDKQRIYLWSSATHFKMSRQYKDYPLAFEDSENESDAVEEKHIDIAKDEPILEEYDIEEEEEDLLEYKPEKEIFEEPEKNVQIENSDFFEN